MKLPKCNYPVCRKASACYLPVKKLYLWQYHRFTRYPKDNSVLLVDDSIIEMNLKGIENWRKDFLAFTQMLNNGSIPPDEDDLSTTVKEELEHIFEELKKAQDTRKYYKFGILSTKTLKIKDFLEQHKLYVEFLVARAWHQSLSIAKGESLKSSEVIEMELKKKYSATFDTMFQKFKELRHDIGQWHQQEVDELREEKKSLKRRKRELKTLYNELVDDYNELEQKARRFEHNITVLEEEIKEKDIALQDFQDTLTAKEEELKTSEQEKENLQTYYENIKEGLISKLNLSECSYLSLLYKITTGEDKQIGPETGLTLELDNPKDMEFLTSLNKRMPDIDSLDLYNIPLNCQEVKTFLATHFLNKVRELLFNSYSSLSSCVPFYLEELVEVSKRVTGQLFIYDFEVPQDQLVSLFSANRHTKYFGLPFCKLSLSSVPDFGGTLAGSTMQALSLTGWGDSSYGDWGNNECHFENLIAGLSKEEDFRKNLKKISMGSCGIEENVVEKVLADHGFGHVEIINYSK